ncbi:MAG: bifunctional diaminohydroxyphosphoribosylaminopyrimidine deaminase/5-amino-6-(5-phosphoribosylamino)uracil reductase RibD [Pyrinomonadaceae bacterium]
MDRTITLTGAVAQTAEMDHQLLQRALELAARGIGRVSPGPLVGCVIVDASGHVVGEGFYLYESVKHAETVALEQAGLRARGGTAYVTLEPHAHYGRTSPCTDALIAAGIKRVVAPIEDSNPEVSGKGFAHLRAAGVEVVTGVLALGAAVLNEKYLHYMKHRLPFAHLKLSVSLDGKIATRSGDSRWITGTEARARVHELRHEYDAIVVGSRTATLDDPLLTDRSGLPRRRPLLRIVLDDRLELSANSQLAKTTNEAPVIVFTGNGVDPRKARALTDCGIEVLSINSRDPINILEELAGRSYQSLLIEGGADVAASFIDARLVNKVTFFVAPKIIGGREAPSAITGRGAATMADALSLEQLSIQRRGDDVEISGYPAEQR